MARCVVCGKQYDRSSRGAKVGACSECYDRYADDPAALQSMAKAKRNRTLIFVLAGLMAVIFIAVTYYTQLGPESEWGRVKTCTAVLQEGDNDARLAAVEELGTIGTDKATKALISALQDADGSVRARAVALLGQRKAEEAVDALAVALSDEDYAVQSNAAAALAAIGSDDAMDALIAALQDEDVFVQMYAAETLGNAGEVRAVESLIPLLQSGDYGVRSAAVTALGDIGDERAVDALIVLVEAGDNAAITALGRIGGEKAVTTLIDLLYADDPDLQEKAAEALGEAGSEAVERLIAIVDDTEGPRFYAAAALGMTDDPLAEERLNEAFDQGDLFIVTGAVDFFIRKGQESSEEVLIEALDAYGDAALAGKYLNSNNTALENAARNWASTHGYMVTTFVYSGDASSASWGSD